MKNSFELKKIKPPNLETTKRTPDPEVLAWDEKLYSIFYKNGKFHPLTRKEWPEGEEDLLRKAFKNDLIILRGEWSNPPGRFYLVQDLRKQWDKK